MSVLDKVWALRALAADQVDRPEGRAAAARAARLEATLSPADRELLQLLDAAPVLPFEALPVIDETCRAFGAVVRLDATGRVHVDGPASSRAAVYGAVQRARSWVRAVRGGGSTRGRWIALGAALRRRRWGLDPDLDLDPEPTDPGELPDGAEVLAAPGIEVPPWTGADTQGEDAAIRWAMDYGWDRAVGYVLDGAPIPGFAALTARRDT